MRKVPELRFDGFDGEWEEKKLSKIAKFSKGKGYSKNDLSNGKYPIYLYGQMYTNYKSQINEIETYTDSIKVNSILSKGNEVLIPSSGETAEDLARASHINISNVLLGGDLNIIEPIDGVNSHFLALELSNGSVKRSLSKKAQGKSVVHLYNSDIKNQKINYTRFEEQEKIGDLFRKLDDLIEIQEAKVSKMEDFKKSMLQKMFPKKGDLVPEFRFDGFDGEWKENKLSEIGDTYTSLSGKAAEDFGHGEAYYVTYMNVYKNSIADINDLGNIEIDNKQNEVLNGDFFFTTSSETPEEVGLSSAWIYDKSNVYLNSFCFGFRPIINIDTSFFAYFFRSENFRRKVVMLAQGSTRFNISKKYMMEISVNYPSLEEQQKIGQFFKNLDTQIENEEKLLDSYKMMKKSLLQKMFV